MSRNGISDKRPELSRRRHCGGGGGGKGGMCFWCFVVAVRAGPSLGQSCAQLVKTLVGAMTALDAHTRLPDVPTPSSTQGIQPGGVGGTQGSASLSGSAREAAVGRSKAS